MQFFLPLATTQEQAERIHARIANHVKEMGYEITPHRMARVVFRRDDRRLSYTVGAPTDTHAMVLAIVKNQVGYFVCTSNQGAGWGYPITVWQATVESADDFDQTDFNKKSPGEDYACRLTTALLLILVETRTRNGNQRLGKPM